ncbi:MAG: hypothetical protein EOO70_04200 [Myxococcaceae bacterium]|nr:MAG: hypothetical protein EOO70_04200 [Myxococcaceae bacterium]
MNKLPQATIHLCLGRETRFLRRGGLITPAPDDYGPDLTNEATNLSESAWTYLTKGVLHPYLFKPLTPEQMVEVVDVIRAETTKSDWPWRETLIFDVTAAEAI